MRSATRKDINDWVYYNHPLQELEITRDLDLSSLRDVPLNASPNRQVNACIFEGAITWAAPGHSTSSSDRLPIETGLIFQACIFKEPLNWAQCDFQEPVVFLSCRFEEYVDFTGSVFRGVTFQDCTFQEKVYFESAVFLRQAGQSQASSHEQCQQVIDAQQPVQQYCPGNQEAQCHCANFRATVFKDGVEFDRAMFDVPACFYKAAFYGSTTFLQSWFGIHSSATTFLDCSYANVFGSVEFHQGLRPPRPPIVPPLIGPPEPMRDDTISDAPITVNMRYIHVHSQQGLRFHSENLEKCFVVGTNLESCHFINIRWPMVASHYPLQFKKHPFVIGPLHLVQCFIGTAVRLVFRLMVSHEEAGNGTHRRGSIRWVEYFRSCGTPTQHGIYDHVVQNLRQEIELNLNTTNDTIRPWRGQWTQLSRAYRDLKAAYEGNKDYIYASDFHYAEKELRRINHEVPRHTRFQLQLYWLVSGYGERVMRPIWWFLAIWVIGALPYYLWGTYAHLKNGKGAIGEGAIVGAHCVSEREQCERTSETKGFGGEAHEANSPAESLP